MNACIYGVVPTQREQVYFIWIGVLSLDSPRKIEMHKQKSDGWMIVDPPWLNGLRMKQQSFRQWIEQFKWNFLLKEDDDNNDYKDENKEN